jgi:prevent-host-death family protein
MIRETSAVTARQNLGELLNQVQYRNDSILITRDGKPVAALVDVAIFERIRRLRDEFLRVTDALAKSYEGVGDATAQAEIDEAVRAARTGRARRARQARQIKKK